MATRDRLAEKRAHQKGSPSGTYGLLSDSGAPETSYELSNVGGSVPGDAMSAFYAEISSIQDSIRAFKDNIAQIGELHSRSLNNTDHRAAEKNTAALDELLSETSALSNTLRRRIKALQAQRVSGRDAEARKHQTGLVKSKFMEAIQEYQTVEQQHRQKVKQRMERQVKIVKPNATPEEVRAAVENENSEIFSQALVNSNFAQARTAQREVQERHEDIKRIEKTLNELAQLFNDMSILVEQQEETIDVIQNQMADVEGNIKDADNHLRDAVVSARAARKKRWICFAIALVIVIIIAIVLAVTLRPK